MAWHHGHTSLTRTFLRSWGNPEQAADAADQDIRASRYSRLWQLYDGTAFSRLEEWSTYRQAFGLYRQTRMVWDHVHSLVEFYATHVWSGSLAANGLHLPDGVPNAIPLAKDTDPTLANAIGQLWTWWNFQESKDMLVRYTAALGECLVELRDDPTRGKILIEIIWPSYIRDLELDESGNVRYYSIEYRYYDKQEQSFFLYRREVDRISFRTFRDDKPHNFNRVPDPSEGSPNLILGEDGRVLDDGPGVGSVIKNPYGFVPAAWFRHIRVLGSRGEPAIWATQAELDEINALFSHIVDKAHISLRAPIVVAGNIAPGAMQRALTSMVGAVKRPFTEDQEPSNADREELNVLQGPSGTAVSTIELKISEAVQALDRIIAGIERKCPEVTFYEQLRGMTQLTGPAAARLLGDVEHKVRSISSGYDRQLIKLQQMGVAMAGWRFAEGAEGWAEQNLSQQKFANYNLDSYNKGDLDHDVMPRELVPMTTMERMMLINAKKTTLEVIPLVELIEEAGYLREDAEKWVAEADAKKAENQAKMLALGETQEPQEPSEATPDIPRPTGAPPGGPQRGRTSGENPRGNAA